MMAAITRIEPPTSGAPAAFVYCHVVSFEETNIVGNVYYARFVSWQGRCREIFLKERVPELINTLGQTFRLVTLRVTCDFFDDVNVFDEIEIWMRLAHLRQHKIGLNFDYRRVGPGREGSVARGFQEIACVDVSSSAPLQVPALLRSALQEFEELAIQ
jgi:enediyne biosynthesis thioesterase